MKTKNLHLIFISLSFLFLISNSCSNSDTENEVIKSDVTKNNIIINSFNSDEVNISQVFKNSIFSFKGHKSKEGLKSSFIISTLDKKVVYETDYDLDYTIQDFKLYQTDKVLNVANKLEYNFDLKTYKNIEYNLRIFFLQIS